MCLHKYDLSGINILHIVMCALIEKKNVNVQFEESHKIVATDNLLSQHYFDYVATLVLFVVTKSGLAFLKS